MHAVMAAQFTSPVPWRWVSRPIVRLGEWGRHQRWLTGMFDVRLSQSSFRMMSSHDHDCRRSRAAVVNNELSSWKQPRPAEAGALKPIGGAQVMVPRPSSVAFKQELVNRVHLIGKLEDDVKVRMLARRQAVANVCLAVQKSANEREPPSWFDLLFWGPFAVLAGQHLKKGDLVHVTGKVTVDTFRKERTVRVFVLDLKFVHGSNNLGAAMAHRPFAGTKSPLSRHSGNNKHVEKKQRRRMDHPKPAQQFLKLHSKVCNFEFNDRRN